MNKTLPDMWGNYHPPESEVEKMDVYEPENIKLWEMPDSYIGPTWPGWYVVYTKTRDSGILGKSNFDAILEALSGESETMRCVTSNHWACGWIKTIMIHQDDYKALEIADKIVGALEDYPIVDDSKFSEYEMNAANDSWYQLYDDDDRISHMRENWDFYKDDIHDLSDLRSICRGEYAPNGRCGYELVLDSSDY